MVRILFSFYFVLFFLGISPSVFAQKKDNKTAGQTLGIDQISAEQLEAYKAQAKDMMTVLEIMLNTLGDPEMPLEDKQTIVNESFAKVFKDAKIQVEDDLDTQRQTYLHKDVQAYLKDIDFFFKEAIFTFDVQQVEHFLSAEQQVYLKITLNRTLEAVDLKNNAVKNNQVRYVEINIDHRNQDLKIVSFYTTKLNEAEELRNWWNGLNAQWREVFGQFVNVTDSISDGQLKTLAALEQLDLSNRSQITDLSPLSQLSNLKILNVEKTAIVDIFPIRNLTGLLQLNVSKTQVSDLSALRYALKIKELDISQTPTTDISVVSNFLELEKFYASQTRIADISALENLTQLKDLRLDKTAIKDIKALADLKELQFLDLGNTSISALEPLKNLKQLERLRLCSTAIKNLQALSGLDNLRLLFINQTAIAEIAPLGNLKSLEKIYSDQTQVTPEKAKAFMAQYPKILVIAASEHLQNWWKDLSPAWKSVFTAQVANNGTPSKEQLAQMARIKQIDVSKNSQITDLNPLRSLLSLQELKAAQSGINNANALKDLIDLQVIDLSQTQVSDLSPLQNLQNLRTLHIENTQVKSLAPLQNLRALQQVYADNAPIERSLSEDFVRKMPNTLLTYRSDELKKWWNNLPNEWKRAFEKYIKVSKEPTIEQLHSLTALHQISISELRSIRDIFPIEAFTYLESFDFSNTSVSSFNTLTQLKSLKSVNFSNTPVNTLVTLASMPQLTEIIAENIAVKDLRPLSGLKQLETLRISGTAIRGNLKTLSGLQSLKNLEIFNTGISNIKHIQGLRSLESLKCYKTRLNAKKVNAFRAARPNCEVIFY
ncbi:leucine-rich repeat domain-containing protein [Hugenholtzia roseola]|uniref:leucine-rich repeat domain-containing protein n=1 Tax=Hugenholtzia roseola TaxID=1002 RepID=UPI00042777CD|nr:leucine-rich repeat domain-containing protein [Hugenholtzia roseola]